MCGMFFAELTIFFQFDSVRSIFLIFVCPVVAILALLAGQSNFDAHCYTLLKKTKSLREGDDSGGRWT